MLLEAARSCSPGIWGGTLRAINKEFELGEIRASYDKLNHETLILWGELDPIIPREHVTEMARDLPNARLVTLPGIGHSANVERPDVFAGAFNAFFGGRQL
jgi:pimeloyl-ACP methyl ester carboxylesterase